MARLTSEQFNQVLNRPGYTLGHAAFYPSVAPFIPHPLPQSDARENPLGEGEDEEGGAGRITVRIERRGTKLLDLDNLYGSVKYVCDALRYAQLIPEDNPEAINLIVKQRKVKRGETGTLIEIL